MEQSGNTGDDFDNRFIGFNFLFCIHSREDRRNTQNMNKKGMEMWMLVLMILAIILLLFVLGWYYGLSKSGGSLLDKVSHLL